MSDNSGPFSKLGQMTQSNVNYNTPPATFANQVRDGVEAILIVRERGNQEPKVWSTGDQSQTEHLLKSTYDTSLTPAG